MPRGTAPPIACHVRTIRDPIALCTHALCNGAGRTRGRGSGPDLHMFAHITLDLHPRKWSTRMRTYRCAGITSSRPSPSGAMRNCPALPGAMGRGMYSVRQHHWQGRHPSTSHPTRGPKSTGATITWKSERMPHAEPVRSRQKPVVPVPHMTRRRNGERNPIPASYEPAVQPTGSRPTTTIRPVACCVDASAPAPRWPRR